MKWQSIRMSTLMESCCLSCCQNVCQTFCNETLINIIWPIRRLLDKVLANYWFHLQNNELVQYVFTEFSRGKHWIEFRRLKCYSEDKRLSVCRNMDGNITCFRFSMYLRNSNKFFSMTFFFFINNRSFESLKILGIKLCLRKD